MPQLKSCLSGLSDTILTASRFTVLMGCTAGIFFPIVNLVFASKEKLSDEAWNNFVRATVIFGLVITPLLSAIQFTTKKPVYVALPTSGNSTPRSMRTIEDGESAIGEDGPELRASQGLPEILPETSLTCKERIHAAAKFIERLIYILSAAGAFVGPLNIARAYSPDFRDAVMNNNITQRAYFGASIASTAMAIGAPLIQSSTQSYSPLLLAFIQTCGDAGAWIGAIFGVVLMQQVVFNQKEISFAETMALSGAMLGLFLTDLLVLYALMRRNTYSKDAQRIVEDTNMVIREPLNFLASGTDKLLWRARFAMDILREFVSVFGNLMSLPNILMLSPNFITNQIEHGDGVRKLFSGLTWVSIFAGLNNTGRIIYGRTRPDLSMN